jgi:Protein of unknown function (DUF1203)
VFGRKKRNADRAEARHLSARQRLRRYAVAFRVVGLPSSLFRSLYRLPEKELAEQGVEVRVADAPTGFPCRVSLRDAPVGSRMLLLNFEHQPANTPYRSRHAIFVQDGAEEVRPGVNEVPEVLASRTLSVRAFDDAGQMVDAAVVNGREAGPAFERLLAVPGAAYLHVHNAGRGCYAARVERA